MKLIHTIYRTNDLLMNGTKLYRLAYRAIIMKDGKCLLVQSTKYGEYKFPGGGIEPTENRWSCLNREVLEETGYPIHKKITPYGKTMEYAKDFLGEVDLFVQESRYYICSIKDIRYPLNRQDYEIEYDYHPKWVSIEEAIQNNEKVPTNDKIPWKERDTLILKRLRDEL